MSNTLSNVAVQQFPSVFTLEYQQLVRKLPPTIMVDTGVVGDIFNTAVTSPFTLSDRGAYQSDIPPIDAQYENVFGTFLNKITNVPTDVFQQGEVKANARRMLAMQAARAINRMEDQIIIDQFTSDPKITKIIPANGTNLTVEKIRRAASQLDIDNVPAGERYFVAHSNQKESLLGQTEATSSDYNSVKTLVEGNIDSFYGFKFIWFGNNPEGGLDLTVDIRTCFAYHKTCALAAYGAVDGFANPGVHVAFDDRSVSWRVIPMLRMGAKVILGEGIVKVLCDESL